MRIQHNITALNAHRQLGTNQTGIGKNLEKLSSGFRINRAGDDAAGLAISEKMRAQIKGLETASKNAQDGISLVQTAEGALTEVHSMLNRMTELATQSANGTYQDTTDRENLQKELNSLRSEVDRIAEATDFNGIKLLDGSMGTGTTGGSAISAAVGAGFDAGAIDFSIAAKEGIEVEFTSVVSATKATTASWAGSKLTIALGAGGSATTFTQADIDAAIKAASGAPEDAAGLKVTLNKDIVSNGTATTAVTGPSVKSEKAAQASAEKGGITVTANQAGARDAAHTFQITAGGGNAVGASVLDDGTIVVNLVSGKDYSAADINKMLKDAGADVTVSYEGTKAGSVLSDTTNGFGTATALDDGAGLAVGGGLELQVGDTNEAHQKVTVKVGNMDSASLGIDKISIANQDSAGEAIKAIKDAINSVSSTRGDLGAIQNRLEHTINNLGVTAENMTAAESRIRDVDMAKEMMEFTKNNILSQAATSMLAQANQTPQGVLQLLQ